MTPEPEPTTVEWGTRRDPFTVVFTPHQVRHYLAYPLAVVGAAAAFASLLLDWQTVETSFNEQDFIEPPENINTVGLTGIFAWGAGWLVGAMVLAVCVALALFGEAAARRHARTVGLAAGGAVLAVLIAAAVDMSRHSLIAVGSPFEQEYRLEPGVHVALVSVVLLGAALWLAPRADAGPRDTGGAAAGGTGAAPGAGAAGTGGRSRWLPRRGGPPDPGPADLTVAPTEPFSDGGAR